MAKRILVVDDDPDFLLTTGHALKSAGYAVVTADSGRQALDQLGKAGPFDLFIIDAMMSTFTEGFELAHELRRREETRETPIVMLTAIEEQFGGRFDAEKDAQALGLNALLRKPVAAPDLLKNVRELTGS
jgi:CheY-like chemotaxis protein